MTLTYVLLGVAVVSTGLFTGLLMTILFFFQRALKDLSGPEFALVMQRFLGIVRTHPLNYIMVITSGTAPIAVLVMLRQSPGSPEFALTLLGLLAFWCGPVLTSRFLAEPIYDVFLGWQSDAPPPDWRAARDRYFRLNVVRGLGSTLAFVCFVVALGDGRLFP
jgi:hypothetical protein